VGTDADSGGLTSLTESDEYEVLVCSGWFWWALVGSVEFWLVLVGLNVFWWGFGAF